MTKERNPQATNVGRRDPRFVALLESAAHLQRLVPGAVLVGGSAAIVYADHRESTDHDHVVADLADRFEMVLEAVEDDEGCASRRSLVVRRNQTRDYLDLAALSEHLGIDRAAETLARMVSR